MKSFALSLSLISLSFCQVFSTYDYTGSKATAMSGAVTSGPSGLHNIFHNPAQLSTIEGKHYINGFTNIFNQDFLPYYNIGLLYNSFAISYEELSTKIGDTDLSSESVLSFSNGFTFYSDRQSLIQSGFRFNFYQFDLGESSGVSGDGSGIELGSTSGYGIDLGFQGVLNERFFIAYYMQNIFSSNIGYGLSNDLPKTLTIGLSYMPYEDLITSFDINQLAGNAQQEIRFGIEYLISDTFILRSGIQNNPNRFSAGFEYKFLEKYNFSYGILTHHIMPSTHQVTFSFIF